KTPGHWLSYWMLFLPAVVPPVATIGHTKRVPVYGAVIEVRVGANNLVIGLVSSARPWIGVKRVDAYQLNEGHDQQNRAENTLLYLMETSNEAQTFLTPYYQS